MPEPKSTYPWAAARKLTSQHNALRLRAGESQSPSANLRQRRRLTKEGACSPADRSAGNLSDCKGLEPDHCPEYRAVLDDVERESVAAVIHPNRPIASDDR